MSHPWSRHLTKTAGSITGKKRVGHWRQLGASEKGVGPGGEEVSGRTWVDGAPPKQKKPTAKPQAKAPPKPPGQLKPGFKPYGHQTDFAAHAEKNKGVIAAHGTGTGKTPSATYAFERLREKGLVNRAIVLTPAGLRTNFAKEGVEKFTNAKVMVMTSPTQAIPGDISYVVVSYAAFRLRPQEFMAAINPDAMIADEFHRASNPQSKTYQAIRQARPQVDRFAGLTASIVQNKPDELAPLVELASGKFDSAAPVGTRKTFRQKHVKRVEVPGQKGIFGGKVKKDVLTNKEQLVQNVGPVVHYVEDLDASEKPPKFVETVETEMSPMQVKLYEMAMSGIDPVVRLKIQRGEEVTESEAAGMFKAIIRARQASNSLHTIVPGMLPLEAATMTPKVIKIMDDLQQHLKETPDGKVVITTNLVHGGVDVLSAALNAAGIPFGVFAGKSIPGMTEKKRQQDVEDYKSGKTRVIIITGAGAEGLSLGNTTLVQSMDGNFNPERIRQMEDRGVRAGGQAHRAPEKRKVVVKRYVSTLPKTFWQKVLFQDPTQSTDQWMYGVAERKKESTREVRDVLARRSQHETKKRDSLLYRIFKRNP